MIDNKVKKYLHKFNNNLRSDQIKKCSIKSTGFWISEEIVKQYYSHQRKLSKIQNPEPIDLLFPLDLDVLADRMYLSKISIRRHIQKLSETKIISIKKNFGGRGIITIEFNSQLL